MDMVSVVINIIIGFVVLFGTLIFYGRSSGWFKEGGLVYEWWQNKKNGKKNKK